MAGYQVSPEAFSFIARFEGFVGEPVALPDGRYLVGYGQTSAAARAPTRQEAEAGLRADLDMLARQLNAALPEGLSQAQFDALVSFAQSIGWAAFVQSDVLRRVKAGQHAAAAMAMLAWRKSSAAAEGAVLEPLVRRRLAEQALFLSDMPIEPAPSVWVRPELDHACAILGAPIAYAASPAQAAPFEEEPLLLDRPLPDDFGQPARPLVRRAKASAEIAALAGLCGYGVALLALAAGLYFTSDPFGRDMLAAATCAVLGAATLLIGAHFLLQTKRSARA